MSQLKVDRVSSNACANSSTSIQQLIGYLSLRVNLGHDVGWNKVLVELQVAHSGSVGYVTPSNSTPRP